MPFGLPPLRVLAYLAVVTLLVAASAWDCVARRAERQRELLEERALQAEAVEARRLEWRAAREAAEHAAKMRGHELLDAEERRRQEAHAARVRVFELEELAWRRQTRQQTAPPQPPPPPPPPPPQEKAA